MNEQLVNTLLGVLGTVLTTAITYGITEIAIFLKKRAASMESEVGRKIAMDTIARAEVACNTAMQATSQTFVEKTKASAKDGKLTNAEALEAMNQALSTAKDILGDASLEILARMSGDVDSYLKSLIEQAVIVDKRNEVQA